MIKQGYENIGEGISIILPVYNEGENIKEQIEQIEKTVDVKHEVLIVYDYEKDSTIAPAKSLNRKFPNVKLVRNKFKRGIISAVRTGFKTSHFGICVVMPADLADDPNTINRMYSKIQEGFDIVCATRYSKGGHKIGGGFVKTALSKTAGLSAGILLGLRTTDLTNGFKMYKKALFSKIKIESDGGWEFSMEILIKTNSMGAKICDVPTIWRERTQGTSKFKMMKWLPKYIHWYLWGILQRLKVDRQ